MELRIRRLTHHDLPSARDMFAMMAEVFQEDHEFLSDAYLMRLLHREDFWAFAATMNGASVGGLTAHTLPMTRSESSEVFIYDLAVRRDHQRRGVGRDLVKTLRDRAASEGLAEVFVPVDNDDEGALDFYRAISGTPSPVTFFTFPGSSTP